MSSGGVGSRRVAMSDGLRARSDSRSAAGSGSRTSRRQVLRLFTLGAGGLVIGGSLGSLLTACGSSQPAAPTSPPASATSAPAPTRSAAATSTPAASSSAATAAPTAAANATPAATPAQAAQTVNTSGTLTVWHYDSNQTLVGSLATLFKEHFPKVTVQNTYIEFSELSKKLIAAAGAKSGPDVIIYGGSDLVQMYRTGTLKSLQPYWDKYSDKGQFDDSLITKFDGDVYGVKPYVNLVAWWYNKDIIDAIGVQPPKTFDEVTPALAKVPASGKKYVPLVLTGQPSDQGAWTAWPWLSGYGFSYDNPDQSAAESTLSLVSGWASKGYLPKEAVTWGQGESWQRFTAGDVAFMQNGNWNIGPAKKQAKFKYGIVPMPTGPKNSTIYLGGEAGWIGAFTKTPDLAWAYLETAYFSKEGNLIEFKNSGSIPARKDMAETAEVKNDPLLAPFLEEVKSRGAEYPPKGGAIVDAQLVVAQNWSAVIAGQKSPSAAAKDLVDGVKASIKS